MKNLEARMVRDLEDAIESVTSATDLAADVEDEFLRGKLDGVLRILESSLEDVYDLGGYASYASSEEEPEEV